MLTCYKVKKMDFSRAIFLYFLVQIKIELSEGYAFENCQDGATPHGNCTVVERDGALGSQSVNAIILNGGYSDFGVRTGCPYQAGSCDKGFSFYGWVKFLSYVTPCDNYGVYFTNQQFAIHLLGNGRLSVYAWMANDLQWHAETAQPVKLNFYYPLILQFYYNKSLGNGSLLLILQDQEAAFSNCTEYRTYKPPLNNTLFGSDGNSTNHYAHIQIDRTNWDGSSQSLEHVIGVLIDPPERKGKCLGKPRATMTRPFQCFWLQNEQKDWKSAYEACNSTVYDAGYPYGRLARFQSEGNFSTWQATKDRFASAGQNASGYTAWIGGGKNLHWLNSNMTVVDDASVPAGVKYVPAGSGTANTCMALSTKTSPWQWLEMNCSSRNAYICEMSWDCMLSNPCLNFGACIPVTDGPTCQCYPGSSGKFCENGKYVPFCVNNCPCVSVQTKFCLAPTPCLIDLRNAAECHKKLIEPLKQRVNSLDLMYNGTLESFLREQYAVKYNETCATMEMELPYGSRDYANSTWAAYLNYRLYAKINSWSAKALCSDRNSTETSKLLYDYDKCVKIFQTAKNTTDFQNIEARHIQAEKDSWNKIFKD